MHLQSLRVSDGCQYACALLEPCVTIADATLNSWKQAHDAFNSRRFKATQPTFIDEDTHRYFTTLVKQAINATEDHEMIAWGTNSYPSEAIAYAVLKLWIEQEQTK